MEAGCSAARPGLQSRATTAISAAAGPQRRCFRRLRSDHLGDSNDPADQRGFCRSSCRRATWAPKRRQRRKWPTSWAPCITRGPRAAAAPGCGDGSAGEVISTEDATAAGAEAAKKAGVRVGFSLSLDADVQALVLERLGVRRRGALRQRPLSWEEASSVLGREPEKLALHLMGRNSFQSVMSVVQDMTDRGVWPHALTVGETDTKSFTVLPTLELCAAICTRILCTARRLHKANPNGMLLVLGIGDGSGLIEASVALHLGVVMQQVVDLTQTPIELKYSPDFGIKIMAVVGDEAQKLDGLEVFSQMPIKSLSLGQFALHFQGENRGRGTVIIVDGFSTSLNKTWLEIPQDDPGASIEEVIIVSLPFGMQPNSSESLLECDEYRHTELFPKTFCCEDFLARGYHGEPEFEAGLFHVHLHVFTQRKAQIPFLVPEICHNHGAYDLRLKADQDMAGINKLRAAGLDNVDSREQLWRPFPNETILMLKETLYNSSSAEAQEEGQVLREELMDALPHLRNRAQKQISLLVKGSADLWKTSLEAWALGV